VLRLEDDEDCFKAQLLGTRAHAVLGSVSRLCCIKIFWILLSGSGMRYSCL